MGKPAGHRVLVKQDNVEHVDETFARAKKAGLVLVEDKREQAAVDTGVVIAVGTTAFKDFGGEPWCTVGDRVAFAKYTGKEITDDGEKYLILNDEDIVYVY